MASETDPRGWEGLVASADICGYRRKALPTLGAYERRAGP